MGAVAAAAIIRKEKEIVEAFRTALAVTPETARTVAALGVHEGVAFRRLRARAVLRDAGGSRLYLDELSWDALQSFRKRLAVLMFCLVVAVGVIAYLTTTR